MTLPEKPHAGVYLHLTSLPGNYGIGEMGRAAFDFIDWMKSAGLKVWQFLPLGPTGYGDSPYQSLSSFAGNELLIDIDELVRMGLLRDIEVRPLQNLSRDSTDYGRLIPAKRALLTLAAQRFDRVADSTLSMLFDEFLHRHFDVWLKDYSLFRVLKSRHGEKAWHEWDTQFAHRDSDALEQATNQFGFPLYSVAVTQFLFDRQCRALKRYAAENGIEMFGDVPIYIALDSADAWSRSEIVRIDENAKPDYVAGVPPDYYSEDGQLWGNPLYDWQYHDRTGYAWWIDRFRHAMAYADLVRIDHFRGFEAYWAIPYGSETARTGAWQPGPGKAIFRALRDGLGELPIVAENLGVITPAVEELRQEYGMPGMVILQFDASKPGFERDHVDGNCVVYTGCHDTDTTQGWFNGGPGDVRSPEEVRQEQRVILEKTGGSPATIHWDLVRLAFDSPARLAIIPMQDFLGLGSEARFNIPGTQANNWRWRVREQQLTRELSAEIGGTVAGAGRAP